MVFIRIIILGLLFAYTLAMARIPASDLNAIGHFFATAFFFIAPAFYLLPLYEAWTRKHPNLTAIALVNVLVGWTLIGWIVAMVWAHKNSGAVGL